MTRSPLFLAALASSAVPGLDPVRVQGVEGRPGDLFEIAYVQDSQDRSWVVKAPCTAAAGAMLDDVSALSDLLGRRIEVAVPLVRGYSPVPEGRAAVYLRLPGRPLDFAALDAGPLAAEVGRTLGHIHNVEHLVFEEAGRPTYDAEAHRRRQLSELDRAAATGHVPTGLLTRWEHELEDVSLWRFAPSAVHGAFIGDNVLAAFDDEDDASTGRVRGVLAWEESRIGDPADDFAELASLAPPATLDAVLEAYADTRVERPDVHLVRRARLAAEMTPLRRLLRALSAGQADVVESTAERLRTLEHQVEADDRRHAREDARRSRRAAREREDAAVAPGSSEPAAETQTAPERPEPDWDATQPHVPFPAPGLTQAISMTPLLDEPRADGAEHSPSTYAVQAGGTPDGTDTGSATADGSSTHSVPPVAAPDGADGGSIPDDAPHDAPHDADHDAGPDSDHHPDHDAARHPGDGLGTGGAVPAAYDPSREGRPDRTVEPDEPPRQPEESQPVPVVAPGSETSAFEIDEVEALPTEDGAVLDLHEGASGFVPVSHRDRQHRDDSN